MIYIDYEINEQESKLVYKYAIGLGCTSEMTKDLTIRSKVVFEGRINFDEYKLLIDRT